MLIVFLTFFPPHSKIPFIYFMVSVSLQNFFYYCLGVLNKAFKRPNVHKVQLHNVKSHNEIVTKRSVNKCLQDKM
jgi:hypothetical protein